MYLQMLSYFAMVCNTSSVISFGCEVEKRTRKYRMRSAQLFPAVWQMLLARHLSSSVLCPIITIYILSQQVLLLCIHFQKVLGIRYNDFRITAAFTAACKRHHTKRTHIITATHDADKSGNTIAVQAERGKYQHRFLRGLVKHSLPFCPLSASSINPGKLRYASGPTQYQPIFLLPVILISIFLPCNPVRQSACSRFFFLIFLKFS